MNQRLRDIREKEKMLEIQALRIELENSQITKQHIVKEATSKEKELKQYVYELEKRQKGQQKQIQKLVRVNGVQSKEIDTLKEERNRAEKNELAWKERYEGEIGLLETFNEKKSKYMYRH